MHRATKGLDGMWKLARNWVMAFLALICGPIASGKTGVCTGLYRMLHESGYPASGIIEETSRNKSGLPVNIAFRHLASGEKWLWTKRDPLHTPPLPFDFPEEPIATAIEHLSLDIAAGLFPIILDEIGLLEIRDEKGFMGWLLGYLSQPNSFLIASLREGREESFLTRLDRAGLQRENLVIKVFRVDEESRKTCLDSVVKWVFRHCPNDVGKLYLN